MILTLIQTHDDIFKGVKMESSYLAERKVDGQGSPTFEDFVFDEEYLILFRSLFFDARANVTSATVAYVKGMAPDAFYFDGQNFDTEKDFVLQLTMPDNFVQQMNNSVNIKMKEYLVCFIMYRWLETKSNEATTYLQRAEICLQDMKRYLEMRTTPRRIRGGYM